MALAEIREGWRGEGGEVIRSFAIITTDANQLMSQVHNRMPAILEEADWPVWLGEREGDPASLLHPAREDVLRLWPVSRLVNNVRNDGPEPLDQPPKNPNGASRFTPIFCSRPEVGMGARDKGRLPRLRTLTVTHQDMSEWVAVRVQPPCAAAGHLCSSPDLAGLSC